MGASTYLRALALSLLGISLGPLSCRSEPSARPSPILVDASTADATIGPEGGTLTHPTGARIVLPPGALAAPTHLTLDGIAPASAEVLGGAALGQGFAAGPEGQRFLLPVVVIVPFDPTRVPEGQSVGNAQIRMAPRASTDFVALQTSADLATRTLRAQTVHFTNFAPAEVATPVIITTSALPDAFGGAVYTQQIDATGGAPPYRWEVAGGATLPDGLTLSSDGVLAGAPTTPNVYEFMLAASDTAGHATQQALVLNVLPISNPQPSLTAMDPSSAVAGSAATAITLTGTGFAPASRALWDDTPLATSYVSASHLTATIPAPRLAAPGSHSIAVSSPAPRGGTSSPLTFTVTPSAQNPVPTIASVTPTTLALSSTDAQIAIDGTNFIPSTSVRIGTQSIPTSYVSATHLIAIVPASYMSVPGTFLIGAYNPAPGGGASPSTIAVVVGNPNPVPTLTALSPGAVPAGTADFVLTLTGTSFAPGGQAFFGTAALATTIGSSTQASATVPAALLANMGLADVAFVNPMPGGGTSNSLPFTITSVSDGGACSATSAAYALALAESIDTQYCQIVGTCTLTDVKTVVPGDGTVTYDGTTLTVDAPAFGIHLTSSGTPNGTSFFDSSTNHLGCLLSASGTAGNRVDIVIDAAAHRASLRRSCNETWHIQYVTDARSTCPPLDSSLCYVSRSLDGRGTCGETPNPVPILTQIAPTSVSALSTVALTATGSSFSPTSQISFAGALVPTTFVSSAQLNASVPSSAIPNEGAYQVRVVSPEPGGGNSAQLPLLVTAFDGGVDAADAGTLGPPSARCARVLGNGGAVTPYGMQTDGTNSIVVAGTYQYRPDFGAGPLPSYGSNDMFVAKLDPSCVLQWNVAWGDIYNDELRNLAVDATGNILASGVFASSSLTIGGTTLTNPGSPNSSARVGFQLTPAGTPQWVTTKLGGFSQPTSAADAGRWVYVDGNTVSAYSTAGTAQWTKVIPAPIASGVAASASGVVIVGAGAENVDLGGGAKADGGYILKLNVDGSYAWDRRFRSYVSQSDTTWLTLRSAALDGAGHVVLAGAALGTQDLGTGPIGVLNAPSVVVLEYDSAGALLWGRAFPTSGTVTVEYVAADAAGNIAVAGWLVPGSIDFGGGALSGGTSGFPVTYLAKLDALGTPLWRTQLGVSVQGTIDSTWIRGLVFDAAGHLDAAGMVQGATDLGSGTISVPSNALFVISYP